MTKYILIGGGEIKSENLMKIAEASVAHAATKSITALIIPFARYENDWQGVFERNSGKYSHPDFFYSYILASQDEGIFINQIKNADQIIITGGSELGLLERMPALSKEDLVGKTIIATSAGVNYLSTKYFSNDRQEISSGIGLLKANTICHFNGSILDKIEELIKINNLPTLALKEGEFVILYA